MGLNGIKAAVITIGGIAVLGVGSVVFGEYVNNGNVGIRYSMSGGVKSKALGQGYHLTGFDRVTEYPVKAQSVSPQTISLASGDGKKTDIKIGYTYHVDQTMAPQVYKKFGNVKVEDIQKSWLTQQLKSASRITLSEYTLLELMGKDSGSIQDSLTKHFNDRTAKYGIVIEDVSLGTPSVDNQTQKSIDDQIKAAQDAKLAKIEAKTRQTKAEAKKKAAITEAEGVAKANEKINASVTDKTIDYMTAKAHQKNGWVTVEGANGTIVDK